MRRFTFVRIVAVVGLALGFQPALAAMSPASAATTPVAVNYTCRSTVFGIENVQGPQSVGITLDLPANVGDAASLTVPLTISTPLHNFPFAVPDAAVSTQISFGFYKVGGALVTTPSAFGSPPAAADLLPNAPLDLNWPTNISLNTSGFTSGDQIEVRPGTIVLQYASSDTGVDGVDGTLVTCTPDPPATPSTPPTIIAGSDVYATANKCVAGPKCNIVQNLNAEVVGNANGLTLQELDNATNFGTVQTKPIDQVLSAALDAVQVQDVRGSDFGWSVTAFANTAFTGQVNPSLTIPAQRLSLSSSCNAVTTDMDGDTIGLPPNSVCTPVSATALPGSGSSSSIGLASSANNAAGTGGTWNIPINGSLTVPAFQPADDYKTVLTIVLSSN